MTLISRVQFCFSSCKPPTHPSPLQLDVQANNPRRFGTFLLFSGKVHFGYIYGLALMGSTALHTILSLMTPDTPDGRASPAHMAAGGHGNTGYPGGDDRGGNLSSTLTFPQSASVLGYCLLPLVLTSLLGIAMLLDCVTGYAVTSLAIC